MFLIVHGAPDPYYGKSGRTNKYVAYNVLLQLNQLASRPNPNKYDYAVIFDRKQGKFGSFYVGEDYFPVLDVVGMEPPENDEVELQIEPIPAALSWLNEIQETKTETWRDRPSLL